MTRRLFPILLLLGLGVLASACGDAVPEAEAASGTGNTATDAPAEVDGLDSNSPIEALLGVPVWDQVAFNAYLANLNREAEVIVAECMLAEGFEYTPETVTTTTTDEVQYGFDTLEYAEQRGFGIVVDIQQRVFDPSALTDPNATYVASLSGAEVDAYYQALGDAQGTDVDVDVDENGVETRSASSGCKGQAETEVFEVFEVMNALDGVAQKFFDLYYADARIIETRKQWSACMAEEGFDFATEDDMFNHVDEILRGMEEDDSLIDFEAMAEMEAAIEAANAFNRDFVPPLSPKGVAALDDLLAEEKRVAVTNWHCNEPIRATELEVRYEWEAKLAEEASPIVAEIRAG